MSFSNFLFHSTTPRKDFESKNQASLEGVGGRRTGERANEAMGEYKGAGEQGGGGGFRRAPPELEEEGGAAEEDAAAEGRRGVSASE